jgi:opacity protein-like surface antigen
MNIRSIASAAMLALVASQAFAAQKTESFDTLSSTYTFGAAQIGAADHSFSFTLNADDGVVAGVYNMVGDLSATNFEFTSAKLNGADWSLLVDSKGKYRFADIDLSSTAPVTIEITGLKFGSGANNGNFQGSLVLTPVPEPETYALMLGGLAAVGFVSLRRNRT